MRLDPRTKLGSYEVQLLLGAGGMGEVYRALDTRLNRVVAIKVLSSDLHHSEHKQRFEREARAIASLNHPHICTIHDVGSQDGLEYLVMEYLEGETLASCLMRGALPIHRVLRHSIEISDALDAAHHRGIIHRDLKPSNIFLTAHGEAKVLDFGLAQMGDEVLQEMRTVTSPAKLTSPGTIVGTLSYMSPEQARCEELDARTDIFSFGSVLYESATGKMAFPGKAAAMVFKAILDDSPPPLNGWNLSLPARLVEIVSKALEKDRDLRYQSAADLRTDLKRLQRECESARISALPVGTAQKVASPQRRVLYVLVITVMIVLLAGLAWWIQRRGIAPTQTVPAIQRSLTRLTFDDGLQFGATWSPDGRYIAYSSDRGGKLDVWVKQVSGGDPIQITKGKGNNWQPDWSPDGRYIAYRSEEGAGGLFVIPALGGAGLERRISSFGYHPRWSPDGSKILFQTHFTWLDANDKFYVTQADGGQPREILAQNIAEHDLWPASAMWHPDGKRVTVWVGRTGRYSERGPNFWTMPITGGPAIKSEISPKVEKQLEEVAVTDIRGEWPVDFTFSWAPSGKAIYFERAYRGTRNIWKLAMDPETLKATAIERLTMGPGPDTETAVSRDGTRLAFTAKSEHVRTWLFPFDLSHSRLRGQGEAITSSGGRAVVPALSRDGQKLVFGVERTGTWELWQKSLVDGHEAPIITDEYVRDSAQWSPDGAHLAYQREKPGEHQLMMWSADKRMEEPLAAMSATEWQNVCDWSPDGKVLLVSQGTDSQLFEIWLVPVADAPHAETAATRIISSPTSNVFQAHFSPDARWIAFETATDTPTGVDSAVYVTRAAGGPWVRLSQGKNWDDKPRWSPDGKTIYFISGRSGFFNVWGVHFNPAAGTLVGTPFAVTAFDQPSLMISQQIEGAELSVTQDRLTLLMEETSGSIWVLDNVEY